MTSAATVLMVGSTAFASGDGGPALGMEVFVGGIQGWQDTVSGQYDGQGWLYEGDYEEPIGGDWGITYDVGLNTVPMPPVPGQVSQNTFLNFGLTNNTGGTETFVVVANLPLLQGLMNMTVSGDVEGTVTDADFNGTATLTDAGGPIYTGLLDGLTELNLMNSPFIETASFDSTDFGPFVGSGPAIQAMAMTDIGLVIEFTLSDGDSASFTANFMVMGDAIPAPGAFALLGLAGLAGRRRRRG